MTADLPIRDLAEKACQYWPDITGAPVLVMHRENSVFRVETTTGPAALRLHRAGYHADAAIRSELQWMAHLGRNGIPVPSPRMSRSGDYIVTVTGDDGVERAADLLTWLDGAPLGRSGVPLEGDRPQKRDIFFRLGAIMADLHRASDDWEPPPGFTRPAWDREGLVGDNPLWGRFWEISGLEATEADLLATIRQRCADDLAAIDRQGADYGLIHADLVRENVMIDGDRVQLIDFDDSGHGYRLFDIATALIKNRREPDYADLEAALIAGYRSRRPLSDADLARLPLFMTLRALTYLGWAEARKEEPGMEARRRRQKAEALDLCRNYLGQD